MAKTRRSPKPRSRQGTGSTTPYASGASFQDAIDSMACSSWPFHIHPECQTTGIILVRVGSVTGGAPPISKRKAQELLAKGVHPSEVEKRRRSSMFNRKTNPIYGTVDYIGHGFKLLNPGRDEDEKPVYHTYPLYLEAKSIQYESETIQKARIQLKEKTKIRENQIALIRQTELTGAMSFFFFRFWSYDKGYFVYALVPYSWLLAAYERKLKVKPDAKSIRVEEIDLPAQFVFVMNDFDKLPNIIWSLFEASSSYRGLDKQGKVE